MPHKDPLVRAAYVLKWSQTPQQRQYQKQYRLEHPEKTKSTDPAKRRSHLKTRYGITDSDYYKMLSAQNGGCAICGTNRPVNGKGNAFFDVDHNHATGQVRGLLCRDCNVTVGVVEKKQSKIRLIHKYLEQHGGING